MGLVALTRRDLAGSAVLLEASARRRLGAAAFQSAWSFGVATPADDMLEYAYASEQPAAAITPESSLTRRELEVATLGERHSVR